MRYEKLNNLFLFYLQLYLGKTNTYYEWHIKRSDKMLPCLSLYQVAGSVFAYCCPCMQHTSVAIHRSLHSSERTVLSSPG